MSMPASPASGPCRPKALTLPTISRGWRSARLRQSRPSSSARPGRKLVSTTSARGHQPLDHRPRVRVAYVERQRVLALIARDEVARLAGRQRRQVAHRIALERLDLDDVRAAVGQELRTERDRDELAELHDLQPRERTRGVHDAEPQQPQAIPSGGDAGSQPELVAAMLGSATRGSIGRSSSRV